MTKDFQKIYSNEVPIIVQEETRIFYNNQISGNYLIRASDFISLKYETSEQYGGGAIACIGSCRLYITLCLFRNCSANAGGGAVCLYNSNSQLYMSKSIGEECLSTSSNTNTNEDIRNQGQFILSYVDENQDRVNTLCMCSCFHCPANTMYRNQRPFAVSGKQLKLQSINSTQNHCQDASAFFAQHGQNVFGSYIYVSNCTNTLCVLIELNDCTGTIQYLTVINSSHSNRDLGFIHTTNCEVTFQYSAIINCNVAGLFQSVNGNQASTWKDSYIDPQISFSDSNIKLDNTYITIQEYPSPYYDEKQRKIDIDKLYRRSQRRKGVFEKQVLF